MTDPEIKVIEQDGERIYTEIPDHLKDLFPSTTTITGQLDKSTPLMYWAAGLSFDYIKDLILEPLKSAVDQKNEHEIDRILGQFYDMPIGYHYKQAKSYHRKKSKEAKDIGSYVHEAAEAIFRAMIEDSPIDIPVDVDIEKPVQALLAWIGENDVKPVLVERKVWAILPGGNQWGYAGRLDLVAYVNGILTTIDHKSAKGIYADAPLQIAAYDYALNDMFDKSIIDIPAPTDQVAILRLDKETGFPEFHPYTKDQAMDYFKCFGFLCCYWHADRQRKENERARKKEVKEKEKANEKEEDPY